VEWRESVAVEKRASFRDDEYWGKGVPGFGDPDASVWVMGLAPQHMAPIEQVECLPAIAVVTGCIALCIALAWVHKKRLCMRMMD
jgi:hypothetical protein